MPRPFEYACRFEEHGHVYRDQHGKRHRSVTQILRDAGCIDFSMVNPRTLLAAQERGTAVHRFTAEWDGLRGHIKLADFLLAVPENLHGYLVQYETFLRETKFRAIAVETERPRLIDVNGEIVGMTPDRVGYWGTKAYGVRSLVILDLKTGVDLIAHPLQTAGYSLGFERVLTLAMQHQRCALYLEPDHYRIKRFTSNLDYHAFLDAIHGGGAYLAQWKAQRKRIA